MRTISYDIDELLKNAYDMRASDLHITIDSPPVFRVNGRLIVKGEELVTKDLSELMGRKLVGEKLWPVFKEKGEIDFSYELAGVSRFRLSVYQQKEAVSLAARVIPDKIPNLEELNMPVILQELAQIPHGLILVTGPTGSGKSTTLASMIDYINKREAKHIITLEDPIEYLHVHQKSIVNQREVGLDTQKFELGLRAALRQDPDIILVGEMRDLETISTAITAAETGHLVLATLHTNSATQTINRVIDVFPPHQQGQIRIQLASVLEGVISQRLLPTADGMGRVAATEILVSHPSVANLIRGEKVEQINNVLQTSQSLGMHTITKSLNELIASGKITREVAAPLLASAGES